MDLQYTFTSIVMNIMLTSHFNNFYFSFKTIGESAF